MQNVIEMALKLLFLLQNHKNHPAAGGLPPGPFCNPFELHQFAWCSA